MIFFPVLAIHHPRLADPFPFALLWPSTQPFRASLRGETPPFQPLSALSPLCSLTHPADPNPAEEPLFLTHLESTPTKVYQNKGL